MLEYAKEPTRPSYLEVDLSAVSYNIKQIQRYVGTDTELMPVIKANAYGLGVLPLKKVLEENKIKRVAVAVAEEAIFLRQHNFNIPIIVLNELLEGEAKKVVEYDLTPGISVYGVAEKLNEEAKKMSKKLKVHIEVDTRNVKSGTYTRKYIRICKKSKEIRKH